MDNPNIVETQGVRHIFPDRRATEVGAHRQERRTQPDPFIQGPVQLAVFPGTLATNYA